MSYLEKIVNVVDNSETFREYTKTEIAEAEALTAEVTMLAEEVKAKAEAKTALLQKLGISEDEAKLLLA